MGTAIVVTVEHLFPFADGAVDESFIPIAAAKHRLLLPRATSWSRFSPSEPIDPTATQACTCEERS